MAIYHFDAKIIGRSSGRSAVASAAYRAAEVLHDDKLDCDHDYSRKEGVIHSEILLPEGAAERWRDRETLWNEVEAGEKRKDAQLARDFELSLPRELGKDEAIRLARDFVQEQLVDRGMVADLNVHWKKARDGEDQPHAHVMVTMREIVPGQDGEAAFGKKVVAWNDRALLKDWRERWAEIVNQRLCENGHDVRIDHRSNEAQGIPLEPQNKIGPAGSRREADAERTAEHEGIARRNGEKIAAKPEIALDALTRQQSTFAKRDLARLINRHTADADQFADVMAKVEASPELVRVGLDARGTERFTTRAMLATERKLEAAAVALGERQSHRVFHNGAPAVGGLKLGNEQAAALAHVTEGRDLSVVVGFAGTGKSTMLGAAREAWEAEGYSVRGAALSGIAAEGLEAGSGISSRTIHSLLHAWSKGYDPLTSRDVLVVDEAGMIGSRQMEQLLSAADKAGAKVVLVGDPEQLQAIEAGAAFRAVAERVGSVEITEVRRQRDAWQQEATRELATGRTAAALDRYETAGMVTGHDTLDGAKAAVVAGWDAVRREQPDTSQIILTYRRADVADLNHRARAVRREAGELGPDHALTTERGERTFAQGDRLYFLRSDRGMGVKNGSLATIESIEGDRLSVRLDGGRSVSFALADYAHVDHGYAATVHKAQGVTVDRAHVLATGLMDRHAAYVGLTRHREAVQIHYSADDIGSREGLARTLSRERLKDTSLDYGTAYAERRGFSVPVSGDRLAAGRAGFRDRYSAHQEQRQQAAERAQQVALEAAQQQAEEAKKTQRVTRRQGPSMGM